MASQIKREHVFGNFKKSRTDGPQKPHKNSEKFKDRPGMSEEHLALIRKLPCCVCPSTPGGEAHHLKSTPDKERGMGLRSTDKWAVPMCHDCHVNGVERAGTRNEFAWFVERRIENVQLLAQDLWKASGALPKMTAIVIAHKQGR